MVGIEKIVIGVLAVLGALLVGNWALQHFNKPRPSAQAMLASYRDGEVTMPAPCVAPSLLAGTGDVDPAVASPNDLYPGSYTNFALYNTGSLGRMGQ